MSLRERLNALASSIRLKAGIHSLLTLDDMIAAVNSISIGLSTEELIILLGRSALTEIRFPAGLDTIGSYAFAGCKLLAMQSLPEGLERIEKFAFSDCILLGINSIPPGVEQIGAYAFANCKGITSLHLPNSILGVDPYAFNGCTEIQSVTVDNGYNADLPLESCSLLTQECLVNIINAYFDNEHTGATRLLTLSSAAFFRIPKGALTEASRKGLSIAHD